MQLQESPIGIERGVDRRFGIVKDIDVSGFLALLGYETADRALEVRESQSSSPRASTYPLVSAHDAIRRSTIVATSR